MGRVVLGDRVGRLGQLAVGCSAAVFDPARDRILLVRRADSGRWDVPGGYMEAGEGVQEGCAREVLEETGWNKSKAAKILGIHLSTLYRKMEAYGIKREA